MARPSALQQLFQENVEQSSNIGLGLHRAATGIFETVSRTKIILSESRELIAAIDRQLARVTT